MPTVSRGCYDVHMPRKAQGTTYLSDGAVYARVVVAPSQYVARSLAGIVEPVRHPCNDACECLGRQWAGTLQELVTTLSSLGRSGEVTKAIETALTVGRE